LPVRFREANDLLFDVLAFRFRLGDLKLAPQSFDGHPVLFS